MSLSFFCFFFPFLYFLSFAVTFPANNMELSWGLNFASALSASTSTPFFGNEEPEMKKFFFFLLKVVTETISKSERTYKRLKLLIEEAFDFFYKKFAADSALIIEDVDFSTAKSAFLEQFRYN